MDYLVDFLRYTALAIISILYIMVVAVRKFLQKDCGICMGINNQILMTAVHRTKPVSVVTEAGAESPCPISNSGSRGKIHLPELRPYMAREAVSSTK